MKLTVTEISMHPKGESPVFSELATKIRLADDGGGPFIILSQDTDEGVSSVRLDFNEIESLMRGVLMLKDCISDDV